ncbi:uncharacterized protein NPIL_278051 [Nephila pilipes]|uniref:Uncharacterized protein n=1 Tax=Nephila pilipes TaxID=299642 RepID=A0A8X6U279_NEPPI|nr:uncharacterized protein NPIL_278051 [Nephila pilipes]
MSEEKAAEKIQASFKGYKVRKSLKNNGALPEKKDVIANNSGKIEEKIKERAKEETASKLNSVQAAVEDELLDIDLTDKDLEKAATKIQLSYRNFTARKKQVEPSTEPQQQEEPTENATEEPPVTKKVENTEEENLDDIDLKDPDVEKAALKIQSTFRGYKTRKEMKNKVHFGVSSNLTDKIQYLQTFWKKKRKEAAISSYLSLHFSFTEEEEKIKTWLMAIYVWNWIYRYKILQKDFVVAFFKPLIENNLTILTSSSRHFFRTNPCICFSRHLD